MAHTANKETTIPDEYRVLLRRMTGAELNSPRSVWGFRNHCIVLVGSTDHQVLSSMESEGMVRRGVGLRDESHVVYEATQLGCELLGMSKATIKKTLNSRWAKDN